jgi:SAM-dependent methyltransferase
LRKVVAALVSFRRIPSSLARKAEHGRWVSGLFASANKFQSDQIACKRDKQLGAKMDADVVSQLWTEYRERTIDQTLHPHDHMCNTAVNGRTDYEAVGRSAMQIIASALISGPSYHVTRIMDFGCGHGRVARHLRSFFPNAELFFSDIDPTCPEFCSRQFGGRSVPSSENFGSLKLPDDLDMIWVGSVFTHLDYGRMVSLFDTLAGALRMRGTLVATFRGAFMYRKMKAEKDPEQQRKWKSLLDQYEAGGIGYASYNSDKPDWGLSLSSVECVIGMSRRHPRLRLINYTEVGWAAVQDVAAWAVSPA